LEFLEFFEFLETRKLGDRVFYWAVLYQLPKSRPKKFPTSIEKTTFTLKILGFDMKTKGVVPIGPVSIGPVHLVLPDWSSIDWSCVFGPMGFII
jgi:hypothetical protein